MKENAKGILKPTLVLVIICLIVTAALAFTNAATKGKIAEQAESDAKQSRLIALPGADSFTKSTKAADCYEGKKGSETVGWVFTTKAGSYGGDITVMTGISKDGKITGVQLTNTSDTPGLGLNAQKPEFRDQYVKNCSPGKQFIVVKSGNAGKSEINAMTGATISSKAVTNAVNEAVAEFQKVKGGE